MSGRAGQALDELLSDVAAVRDVLRNGKRAYVYVLHRPNGQPFYVGKGVGERCLGHEAEARTTRRLTHKLNVIRALHRRGERIHYRIDSFHDDEVDALARERQLIASIGRHDLKMGPLTNQTDGGEGTSNPSEQSCERRRQSLYGDNAEDQERQVANRYFQQLTSVRSVTLKAAATFKAEPLWRNRATFQMSVRQAATLVASAIANRVMLEPGARIPRRLTIKTVELIIENGAGRDMLSSDMVETEVDDPTREIFRLTEAGYRYVVEHFDRDFLIDAGILEPS